MTEKRVLRTHISAERRARSNDPARFERATEGFTRELCAAVERVQATRVACFVGVRGEPDTAPFLEWARRRGVDVLLPRSRLSGTIEWGQLSAGTLSPGAFGIPEPAGGTLSPQGFAGVDLVFVPAAAVDIEGSRLGWGRGYYDRELAELRRRSEAPPPIFAVVFESEVLQQIPTEPHDVPVDGAITELRTHYFG